jgi:hypothetical protein
LHTLTFYAKGRCSIQICGEHALHNLKRMEALMSEVPGILEFFTMRSLHIGARLRNTRDGQHLFHQE